MTHIGNVARGHWRSLLPALGVDSRFLVNKHGPCPICGGRDRFRWDDFNHGGGFFCNQCGSGDGFDLVQKVTGKSFRQIADEIASMLGKSNEYQKQPDNEEKRQRAAMLRVWMHSFGPIQDSPVDMYLNMRCGTSWHSESIRELIADKGPFMVAKIMGHDDRLVNLHLTALTWIGRKADVTPAKRVMAGKLPDGCAIRLAPAAPVMGVAEGIETAISAAIMFDMPVWACVNGTLLSKWVPPDNAEQITIFADNDVNYTGHAKAYHLANRLEVQYKRAVTVRLPPCIGTDWNDHHQDVMDGLHKTALRVVK